MRPKVTIIEETNKDLLLKKIDVNEILQGGGGVELGTQ
ncbi:MAG: hypothetical protein EZS28_048534, partial [Streblomastix strix]